MSADEAEVWLQHARAELALIEDAHIGPLETFANPRLLLSGFKASFGKEPSQRGTRVFVTLSQPDCTVVLQSKCEPGFENVLAHILWTLRPATAAPSASSTESTPAEAYCYSVYDLQFDSPQLLLPPASFAFASERDDVRIWCRRGPQSPTIAGPAWNERFGLAPETTLTVVPESPQVLHGRQATAVGEESLAIHEQHWLATADAPGGLRQLMHAEAWTAAGGDFFHFMLAAQGSARALLELWSSLLASAYRD